MIYYHTVDAPVDITKVNSNVLFDSEKHFAIFVSIGRTTEKHLHVKEYQDSSMCMELKKIALCY